MCIATDPAGNLVYTANGTSDDVSVVDAKSMAILARIKTGGRPWGVPGRILLGLCVVSPGNASVGGVVLL